MINPFSKFKEYYKKMKTVRLVAVSFIFAAVFAISAFAQTGAAAKIVVIDTGAFAGDEKGVGGITKYVNAMNALDAEFQPAQKELQTIANKIQTLQNEIQKLQTPANPNVPIADTTQKTLQTKAEEAQNLQIEFKRKQEDAKVKFERRQQVIMGPVMQDIFKSLQDFSKQKGYDLILDASKLDAQQMILGYNPDKVDVTKEFITFYNARPAGAATAAAPK